MTAPARPRPPFPPGPVLVVGLARSGQAAARLLAARGRRVIAVDSGSPDGAEGLRALGVEVFLDADGVELVAQAASVVKSPGVPREAAAIRAAEGAGLAIIGELELGWRALENRFVAVTGTNGKTTVTELLGHVWRTAAEPVAVAGNVGTPLASIVDTVDRAATVVCEVSSFQLEDTVAFAPDCGVLLNLTPDHLDRHRTFERYREAKLRIFAGQTADDVCVFNGSDRSLAGVALGGRARRLAFCVADRRGAGLEAGGGDVGRGGCAALVRDDLLELQGEPLVRAAEIGLLGPHNLENAAAAALAADSMGINRGSIAEGLRTFAGVAHRLERVGERDGVLYVNDSKATNPAAASAALRSFEGGVRAILGGSLKGGGFEELAEPISRRCVACYLIGEAAPRLERELAPAWEAGVAHRRCGDLPGAVAAAAADAAPGEVVLLAPACASFDAYRDFEARGEHFRELVGGLR